MEAKFNNWIMVKVWWVMLRGMNFAFIRSAFFLLVVMVYVCTYTQPASCSSLLMFFCVLVVVPDLIWHCLCLHFPSLPCGCFTQVISELYNIHWYLNMNLVIFLWIDQISLDQNSCTPIVY